MITPTGGKVLRPDHATAEGMTDENQVRLGSASLKMTTRWCGTKGKAWLHIVRPVSAALYGSIVELVETLEGPALAIKLPDDELPPSEGP